jgi:hypothetical protein
MASSFKVKVLDQNRLATFLGTITTISHDICSGNSRPLIIAYRVNPREASIFWKTNDDLLTSLSSEVIPRSYGVSRIEGNLELLIIITSR